MGEVPEIPSERLAIRIDTFLGKLYSQPELHFTMRTSLDDYNSHSIDLLIPEATDAPHTRSNRTDVILFRIDTSYRKNNMTGNRLLALGNVKLPALQANKVEWLDMDLSGGRITDFENYRKLRGITHCGVRIFYNWATGNYEYTRDLATTQLRTEGDPFFWEDILPCPKLETLLLRRNDSELLFLDEELGKVMSTHRMKSLHLEGIPYMPLNFKDYKSLEYIYLWSVYLPEAINMAIVLNSFGKDTTTGDWPKYLDITKEKSIIIPENGAFETHYVNDLPICKGVFKNNQPDGKWEFYYDNGQLCEQRFYDQGKKTGLWLFFEPDGDTSSVFRYNNGKLIYRMDQIDDHDHPCDNYEFSYNVVKKTTYQLEWKNDNEVSISKNQTSVVTEKYRTFINTNKDTLSDIRENWHFTRDDWEYSWIYHCKENRDTYERHNKGRMGENVYYGRSVQKNPTTIGEYPNEHRCMEIREEIIDFMNNIHEENEYNDDNPEKMMKKAYSWSRPITEKKEEKEKLKRSKDQEEDND